MEPLAPTAPYAFAVLCSFFIFWIIAEIYWSWKFRLLWGGICMFCLINLICGVYSGSGRISVEYHFAILSVRNKLLEKEVDHVKVDHVIRAVEKFESVFRETKSSHKSIRAFDLALREPFPQLLSRDIPPIENTDAKPDNGDLENPFDQSKE
jgi:hypothetical protein